MTDLSQGNRAGDGATRSTGYLPGGRAGTGSDTPSATDRSATDLSATDLSATDATDLSAKDRATHVARSGKQAAGEVAQTASGAAKDMVHETKDQASDLYAQTKSQLSDQVVTQKATMVDSLRSLADQLAAMTGGTEETGTAVDLAGKARDQARGAADWLDGHDPSEVLAELRTLGRRKPGKFLLGALMAGVVSGRLTRGVVAVHTDDGNTSDDPGSADRASSPLDHRLPGAPTLSSSARHGTTPEMPVYDGRSRYAPDGTSSR